MFLKKISKPFKRFVKSIAFIPALIGLGFLIFAIAFVYFDYSKYGRNLIKDISWLTLKDSSTARSLVSSIVTGIISLTVFSFSMVMIVLNQAATNMTNRILNQLIGQRFQQIVLGIYLGTIIYALFVLSTIRSYEDYLNIPVLSIYFLILLTILDIFLFIYFLHYITQNVKYNNVIFDLKATTLKHLKQQCCSDIIATSDFELPEKHAIRMPRSAIFNGFSECLITDFCQEHNVQLQFKYFIGTYLLKDTEFAFSSKKLTDDQTENLIKFLTIDNNANIESNFVYGFVQLKEIACRALSPGINDPGTAVLAIRALFDLYHEKLSYPDTNAVLDARKNILVIYEQFNLEQIIKLSLINVWQYGKKDYTIQEEMKILIAQLSSKLYSETLQEILKDENIINRS